MVSPLDVVLEHLSWQVLLWDAAQHWEDYRVCSPLLQAAMSFNHPPNLIKPHLGSAQGFVFLATPSARLFQSFVLLAGNLSTLFMANRYLVFMPVFSFSLNEKQLQLKST